MSATPYVGIDVSKAVLDVAVRPSGQAWQVANDEPGIGELVARLRGLGAMLVVCEATGGFERPVVATLAPARVPIVVANPCQVRDFARSTGQLETVVRTVVAVDSSEALSFELAVRVAEVVAPALNTALPTWD